MEAHAGGHDGHPGEEYPGVLVALDWVSEDEERALMKGIDEMPWDGSQSGRRKQNFGPKTNFKKNKLQLGQFRGFPHFSKFVQDRFEQVPLMANFQTIEQCSLEYTPEQEPRSIRIDDCRCFVTCSVGAFADMQVIRERRVCLAYREFTPMYLQEGSEYAKSEEVFCKAQAFWDHLQEEVPPVNGQA
ncbi:hypothetical protein pipiens_011738 [Culex pipiens pipiens]|uniref:Uncharacterized protein n=1 Tax=Culex pipiens pipiens TaxID=38569 RepID=A0ABD1D545_CULPP